MSIASHAFVMSATDDTARLWIDAKKRFAKLVLNGRTIARIDRFVDGSIESTADGNRTPMPSWEAASAWITARATAQALTHGLEVFA